MISPTVIGQLEYWDWNGISYTLRSANYYVNNPGPVLTVAEAPGLLT